MKLIVFGALAAMVGALKVDSEHKSIFQGCNKSSDCPEGKWCNNSAALWNYCMDCCYYGDSTCYQCK